MSKLDINLPDTSHEDEERGEGSIIGKSGIPHRDTFDVLDSSKIQTFQDCPRKFFFRHILGWRSTEPNIHLVFGSAWHEAMEHLLLNGYSTKDVQQAYNRFMDVYNEEYPEEWLAPDHRAKNPGRALEALVNYTEEWKTDHRDFDVLYTEIAGTAPISEEDLIHFKIDTIIENREGVWTLEHKTTGRNSQSWRNKWELITQIGTYIHALYCLFPEEKVQGATINGTVIRSKDEDFLRIPVRKKQKEMEFWLWETRNYIQQIKLNMEWLAECSPSDQIMAAFPRNPQSCTKYSGCPFVEYCSHKCNPLKYQEQPPQGMKREFWDPRGRGKHQVDLSKDTKIKEVEGNGEDD